MLQPSMATAIMQAFLGTRASMASEPVDFSAGPAEPRNGAEVIPIVSPTVVAFIGRTERGPLNEPVVVKAFEDFSRIFGGNVSFSFVSLAVQHFFSHGGAVAVIVRVANRATRATLDIPAGRETLRLQARQPGSREHLRVSVDYDRVERTLDKFNLVIQRVSRAGSQLIDDQEVFEGLSMDPTDERFIVDACKAPSSCARRAATELSAVRDGAAESASDSLYNGEASRLRRQTLPTTTSSARTPRARACSRSTLSSEWTSSAYLRRPGATSAARASSPRRAIASGAARCWFGIRLGLDERRLGGAGAAHSAHASRQALTTSRACGRVAISAAMSPAFQPAARWPVCSRAATWVASGTGCRPSTRL
jgi:hypothetical protein